MSQSTPRQNRFYRKMVESPKKYRPYGITDEVVFKHRLTSEQAAKFIMDEYFPEETYLWGGKKGSFTRKLNRCRFVLDPAWDRIDREGRPGLYRVTTRGGTYESPSHLGIVVANNVDQSKIIAQTMFAHVYGKPRWEGHTIEIDTDFLGGSRNVSKESLFALNHETISEHQTAIAEQRKQIKESQELIELWQERIQVIGSFDYDILFDDD